MKFSVPPFFSVAPCRVTPISRAGRPRGVPDPDPVRSGDFDECKRKAPQRSLQGLRAFHTARCVQERVGALAITLPGTGGDAAG